MQRFSRIIALILLSTTTLFAQKIVGTISGTDATDGLAGAAVLVVGTTNGTVTEADGRFAIGQIDYGEHQLRISLLGYRTQTVSVSVSPTQPLAAVDLRLEPGSFDLDELTVSATRAAANTPVTYVNVGKEEIANNNLGQDLPFVLKWTPSVVVTSDAGAGVGYTGIWIRGSDPARTNVTINGIPFNDSESQGTFWVNLPDFAAMLKKFKSNGAWVPAPTEPGHLALLSIFPLIHLMRRLTVALTPESVLSAPAGLIYASARAC